MLNWKSGSLGSDPAKIPGIVEMDRAVQRARRTRTAVRKGRATQSQVIESIEALVRAEKTAVDLSRSLCVPAKLWDAVKEERIWLLENCIRSAA